MSSSVPIQSPPITLNYSNLPHWRRDNSSILTGYRAETGSWFGCVRGWGFWHNETVNIWTHLIGAIVSFVVLLLYYLGRPESPLEWLHTDDTRYEVAGILLFLFGCFVCFTCSAAFHTSVCHSERVAQFMNRVDYLGILVLGTLNYMPTFHYAFFCNPEIRNVYITLMTVSGSTGIYLVCAPTYASPAYRRMRTYTFFALGFVVIFPFFHAIWQYGLDHVATAISLKWLTVEAVAYICGALLYAERCPEYLHPGKFDYIGSSHQIFHICSMIATFAHYLSLLESFKHWHFGNGIAVCG